MAIIKRQKREKLTSGIGWRQRVSVDGVEYLLVARRDRQKKGRLFGHRIFWWRGRIAMHPWQPEQKMLFEGKIPSKRITIRKFLKLAGVDV